MNELNQEDWLDRQLREAAPYINDAGFTAGVLAKMPPRRQPRFSSRAVILIGLTLIGSLLAYILSGGGAFVFEGIARVSALPLLWLFIAAFVCGILVTTGGLIAAVAKSRELQS
jgi:hypothetical protein